MEKKKKGKEGSICKGRREVQIRERQLAADSPKAAHQEDSYVLTLGKGMETRGFNILFLGETAWNDKDIGESGTSYCDCGKAHKKTWEEYCHLAQGKKDFGGSLCFFKLGYNL